jgi:3-deoxy-manno-octulosonate cytidylyltransferase (CMP-KDO synthetase)
VAEVSARSPHAKVVNVQGDEPDLDPKLVDRVVDLLDEAEMATIATPSDDLAAPSRVKVVVDQDGWALYFSRAPMAGALLHLGLYGYTKKFLAKFVKLPVAPPETAEKLEQLRALWHGHRIRVAIVKTAGLGGIDTREDYDAFVRRYAIDHSAPV